VLLFFKGVVICFWKIAKNKISGFFFRIVLKNC